MGLEVRIGQITASSPSLVPSFELRDVQLLDRAGQPTLQLGKVWVALSPRSLMRLGVEQLVIEQPALDVRRDAQGRINVAGLVIDPKAGSSDDSPAADWLFSQRELAIRGGQITWTDELLGQSAVSLQDVNLVVRNRGRDHAIRVDAMPPALWGERIMLIAQMRSPLFTRSPGRWQAWDGQVYAELPRVDVSHLRQHVRLGADLQSGLGSGRLWASVQDGAISGVSSDVSLTGVSVQLESARPPLALRNLAGRVEARQVAGGLEVATQNLQFTTQDGLAWPGGNLRFLQTAAESAADGRGEFSADQLELGALAQIADRLPLGTATHSLLASLKPQGLIHHVDVTWRGHYSAPVGYAAKGKASGLSLASQAPTVPAVSTQSHPTGRPGFSGVDVDFDVNERGGKAKLQVKAGAVDFPGVFEEPVIKIDQLQTDATWVLQGERIELKLANLSFANADAQGAAQAVWHTSDPATSRSKSRFPGVLDLQGTLTRADGARVHRYLPLGVPQEARHYVRDAVLSGAVSNGSFKIKGDLFDLPYSDPKLGEFRIAGQVKDVQFAYVPQRLLPAGGKPWPSLTQLTGELVFDRASMSVNNATGRMEGKLPVTQVQARIADLARAQTVLVEAQARGNVTDMLEIVSSSPLAELTQSALNSAKVSGGGDLRLKLQLPIFDLTQSKVQGSLTLAGNDVQITEDSPRLQRARGAVQFSEKGFALQGVTARMLGGDVRLDGGSRPNAGPTDASVTIRAQGSISAEALRQATELGFVSRLAQYATGSTGYAAVLGFRRGTPELNITSNLQGLAFNLPAPLNKSAEAVWPLRFDNSLLQSTPGSAQQDQWTLDLGNVVSVAYIRDITGRSEGREPRVLRGGIAVGLAPGESLVIGDSDVVANVNFTRIDADAWDRIITQVAGTTDSGAGRAAEASRTARARTDRSELGYLPSTLAIRAQEFTAQGRTLNQVVLGGSRDGLTWRANLDARELSGYVEFRQPSGNNPGRVYARLARLSLAPSTASDIETALEQPQAIPALDIVVEDLELRNKRFGRVEIEAVNRGLATGREAVREWRLNKLNVSMPEASFTATGNWAAVGANSFSSPGGRNPERRRTALNFKLDIANSGELLRRFGFDGVVARGKGVMEGQIVWLGSPLALDYPSLSGGFNVNIESGQFLKADPGAAKLLGVLSLQSLPRRLTLDFRDVFTEGFAFDFVRGDVKIEQGIASTNNLQMKGVNAAVLMEGKADIAKETQNLRVVVVPEINAGTASLVAAAINPAIGLGTFLAQLILRRPMIKAATQEFQVDGSWTDPRITKVARDAAPAESPTPTQPPGSN
jgi:uncharacterized protein (TIGR02099 family)